MSKSFQELLDRAFDIKVLFRVSWYELHQYEDGSYVDFHVQRVDCLPKLLELAGSLELKFFPANGYMIVRLIEDYEEWSGAPNLGHFFVSRLLNLLIICKISSRFAAIFPAHPPFGRDFLSVFFKSCDTVGALSAPYQVRIWFE